MVLKAMFTLFRTEVLGTSRKALLRLVMTEGPRFPAIAEFYHREVVSRGIKLMGGVLARAEARGELSAEGLTRFPQLVLAPLILAVIWDGLFASLEPLDVEGLLEVHRKLLLQSPGEGEQA
jgi:Tetracyclin repressor-like, C-terminal domain